MLVEFGGVSFGRFLSPKINSPHAPFLLAPNCGSLFPQGKELSLSVCYHLFEGDRFPRFPLPSSMDLPPPLFLGTSYSLTYLLLPLVICHSFNPTPFPFFLLSSTPLREPLGLFFFPPRVSPTGLGSPFNCSLDPVAASEVQIGIQYWFGVVTSFFPRVFISKFPPIGPG